MPSIKPVDYVVKNIPNAVEAIKNRERIFNSAKKIYTSDPRIIDDAILNFYQGAGKYTLMGIPYTGNTITKTDVSICYRTYKNGQCVRALEIDAAGDMLELSNRSHYMILNKKKGIFENSKSGFHNGILGIFRDVFTKDGVKTSAFYQPV